ncbi:MAG: hypothetical protein WCI94_22920 [Rhodospirillales bacterium]
MKRFLVLLLLTGLAACEGPRQDALASTPTGVWREQIVWVPYDRQFGGIHYLFARLCRPASDREARVVVYAHGTPSDPSIRPTMKPLTCESEAAQWFLKRGHIVVAAMRTGYGQSAGSYAENSSPCETVDFIRAGRETARQIAAVVNFATALPGARPTGAIVVGQSAGGWGAVAYDAMPHPKVAAMVSMAGGRGGHMGGRANDNCRPDRLAAAAGAFGAEATTPMLWIYTENDSYFAPPIASAMYAAFAKAGGAAKFLQLRPFASDGHGLFLGRGGSTIWGPAIERYLAERGIKDGQ